MNKTAVYTAIYGGKDVLIENQYRIPNADYILFTDNKEIKSKLWKIIHIPPEMECNVRNARRFKILPHMWLSNYEYSIWVDGNIKILKDLNPLVDSGTRWMVFGHGRYCIYDEADACIQFKKDNPNVIRSHVKKYINSGYPKNNGLWSTGVLIRKHNNADIIKMNEMWWEEIKNGSRRDQISAPYVAWKCGLTPDYIEGKTGDLIQKNGWIRICGHKR